MNLAQAFGRGLIAEAIAERRRPGPTIEECKSTGTVSIRVHQADLPDAPTDYGAERERMRRRHGGAASRRADPRGAGRSETAAQRICGAIRRAGRRLYWSEIETFADMACGRLGPTMRKLLARGTLDRTGVSRHYLYGFPGMD